MNTVPGNHHGTGQSLPSARPLRRVPLCRRSHLSVDKTVEFHKDGRPFPPEPIYADSTLRRKTGKAGPDLNEEQGGCAVQPDREGDKRRAEFAGDRALLRSRHVSPSSLLPSLVGNNRETTLSLSGTDTPSSSMAERSAAAVGNCG